MDTMAWIVTGAASLLIMILLVIAGRTGKAKRDRKDEEAFRRFREERAAALAEAQRAVEAEREQAGETPAADQPEEAGPEEIRALTDGSDRLPPDEEEEEEPDEAEETMDEEPESEEEESDEEEEEPDEEEPDSEEELDSDEEELDADEEDDEDTEETSEEEEEEEPDAEPAADDLPGTVDGRCLWRVLEDVPAIPAIGVQQDITLGGEAALLPIGRNLFVQQGRKIIGRVKKKATAQELIGWQREKRPVCARVTGLDAEEECLVLRIGLYDDPREAALREELPTLKLGGAKREEIQDALNDTPLGAVCTLTLEERADKEPRWLVHSKSGVIGTLEAGEAEAGRRAVLMAIEPRKKGDGNKGYVALI
ncbi:MAG: hypothetical protein IJK28_03325 [Clostridia bacterium]|nr:hypothetical protein [Clostridia bacterium]